MSSSLLYVFMRVRRTSELNEWVSDWGESNVWLLAFAPGCLWVNSRAFFRLVALIGECVRDVDGDWWVRSPEVPSVGPLKSRSDIGDVILPLNLYNLHTKHIVCPPSGAVCDLCTIYLMSVISLNWTCVLLPPGWILIRGLDTESRLSRIQTVFDSDASWIQMHNIE